MEISQKLSNSKQSIPLTAPLFVIHINWIYHELSQWHLEWFWKVYRADATQR
jgi:hypothetical protein